MYFKYFLELISCIVSLSMTVHKIGICVRVEPKSVGVRIYCIRII